MNYLLRVCDHLNQHLVVITLDQQTAKQPAVDIVFEILGAEKADELVAEGRLPEGQIDDFYALQKQIFDRDNDGLFISNNVDFLANGEALDPEAPLLQAFVPSERDSVKYMRCDLVILDKATGGQATAQSGSLPAQATIEKKIEEYSRVMFLHQIAVGTIIDVTKDNGDLVDTISYAERENLLEIDVKKAAYKLSEKGKRMHDSYIAEAQDLIKRFDIYGDVDVDASGTAHFDTNLGRDLRVAAFEIEGVDPFRARFLLGLNDGEWDKLENWSEVFQEPSWYSQIFAPIEQATSIEEIGESKLRAIIEQAKAALRRGS